MTQMTPYSSSNHVSSCYLQQQENFCTYSNSKDSLVIQNWHTKRLSKVERLKYSSLPLENPRLNDIIIGLLLGDGHIQKRSLSGNSRFIYGQSSLRIHHLNYFLHVFKLLLTPYISKNFILKERRFTDKRTNNEYRSVNFQTLSLPCFNFCLQKVFFILKICRRIRPR